MRIRNLRLAVLLVLCVLCVREAAAKGTFAVTLADYNAAQVVQANGTVTVPYGQVVGGTFFSAQYIVASGTQLELHSNFNVTLPSGFTFGSTPHLTASAGGTLSLYSGGVGAQTATYEITGAAIPGNATISFGTFSVAGTTSQLGIPFSPTLNMSVQATSNLIANNDDTSPLSKPAFVASNGAFPNPPTAGGGSIDFTPPS